jgi:hypothetical protein
MAIYKPSLLDKFKDFVNGLRSNWDQYEDHVTDFESHLAESVSQVGGVHGLEVEEGTFTPYFDLTPEDTITYSQQIGKYIKVGNLVHLSVRLTLSSVNVASGGNLLIRGLPFAGTPTPVPASFVFANLNTDGVGVVQGSIAADYIGLQWINTGGGSFKNVSKTALKSNTDFRASLTYKLD